MATAAAVPAAAPSDLTEEFRYLPLSALRESPLNPRQHYDQRALEELAESLATHGVLMPLLARPSTDGWMDTYELAAGHRRFRAAQLAHLDVVPVRVRAMTDEQFLEVLTVENLQREDVHPLDEALGYRALLELPGYDVAALAAKVGKSASYVYQRLKLADLGDEVRNAVWAGRLPVSHAIVLARLPAAQQAQGLKLAFNWDEALRPVGRLVEDLRRAFHVDLARAPFDQEDATLLPAAGSCAACAKCTGNAPALFADLQGERECTDRGCYDGKVKAHVARHVRQAAAEGRELVQISSRYDYNRRPVKPGRPIPQPQWQPSKGKGSVSAIVVDGDDAGRIVPVKLDLAPAPEPGAEERAAPAPASPVSNRRDWQLEDKIRGEVARRARLALVERATAVDDGLIAVLVAALWGTVYGDTEEELRELLGMPAPPKATTPASWSERVTRLQEAIVAAAEPVRAKALLLIALDGGDDPMDGAVGPWPTAAKRFGVDLAGLYRAVRKELTPAPKPEKPAKAEKKADAKKTTTKPRAGDVARAKKSTKQAAKKKAKKSAAATERPALDEYTSQCARCGCTWDEACPEGCAWDPGAWARGEAICTACIE